MSLWETRPGLAAEHAEVIVCSPMDPHPLALMKGEVLTQAVTHSRSSLRQVTAAGGVGQCPQHLRQSLLLDPAAVYKRYSLHLSLVYPDAPEWGTFIPVYREMWGVSVLYCFSIAETSPWMRQFPGLLQPRREFPSLMSLVFILRLTWPRWKACPPSRLVGFPLFGIFLFLLFLEE